MNDIIEDLKKNLSNSNNSLKEYEFTFEDFKELIKDAYEVDENLISNIDDDHFGTYRDAYNRLCLYMLYAQALKHYSFTQEEALKNYHKMLADREKLINTLTTDAINIFNKALFEEENKS